MFLYIESMLFYMKTLGEKNDESTCELFPIRWGKERNSNTMTATPRVCLRSC